MSNSVTKQILGANIRKLREERGWTQAELSRRTGVDSKSVSRYENGVSFPTAEHIDALAEAFRVRVSVLFNVEEKMEESPDDFDSLSKLIVEEEANACAVRVASRICSLIEQKYGNSR